MAEGLSSGGTQEFFKGHHFSHEIGTFGSDLVKCGIIELDPSNGDALEYFGIRFGFKGRFAGEECICNGANRPNITGAMVVPCDNLRGNIKGASDDIVKGFARFFKSGEAKVNKLEGMKIVRVLEEEVLGFEIAMNQVVFVAILDGREETLYLKNG
jgi:hypothetical protein